VVECLSSIYKTPGLNPNYSRNYTHTHIHIHTHTHTHTHTEHKIERFETSMNDLPIMKWKGES
jgi:hypothetical protein